MNSWFSFLLPWLLVLWLIQATARCLRWAGERPGKREHRQQLLRTFSDILRSLLGIRAEALRREDQGGKEKGWRYRSLRVFLKSPWPACLVSGIASAIMVMVPVRGIPLGRWVAGLNWHPSIPLLGFLAGAVWKRFFGSDPFRPKDRLTGWLFGGLAGSILYPLSMGLGSVDPYALGWGWSALFPVIALLTIYLIWKQNRFGILLLVSIVAYDFRCLESPNFWDYLIDPVYWLLSVFLLIWEVWKKLRGEKQSRVPQSICSQATVK